MKALLFDLGGVILELDVAKVFAHWARASDTDTKNMVEHWSTDDAYAAHEVGAIDFAEYSQHLAKKYGISMTEQEWLDGWNALFVAPFADVANKLPAVAERLPTFCYTNTNSEHQDVWASRYATALTPFQKIYVSSEIGRRKPDVDSYLWVANDMGFDPQDIMFIDDNRDNIEGASAAGLQTTYVTDVSVTESLLDRVIAEFNPGD